MTERKDVTMTRIAINGFGRIGRNTLRALLARGGEDLEVVAVNDLTAPETLAHLFRYDSALGPFAGTVEVDGDTLVIDGRPIRVLAEREPAELPWADLGVEVVLESTGRFTARDAAAGHLTAGARRVLISAPATGADATIAYGVNTDVFDPAVHTVVSNASCTTNALAPLASVLDDLAGIEHGFMTTVHAYTQEQNLQDGPHRDLRRARAAGVNIVPTSTGAAKAIGLVLPRLSGKLSGDAIRVPVPVGSIVELNTVVSRDVSVDEVNEAYRAAAAGPLAGVLAFTADPLVSTDITGRPESSIFDSLLTRVDEGRHVKVVAWYDNEWGFSNRVVDTLGMLARA
jgi:glyceraldehyde 3-phosphate dehydrogenase